MLTEKQRKVLENYLQRLGANSADDLTRHLLTGLERDRFEEFVIAHTDLTKPTIIYYLQKMTAELPDKGSADDAIRVIIDKLDQYLSMAA